MNMPSEKEPAARRILVLGAYGLIGSGIARRLRADGHLVTGLGRNRQTGQRVLPDLKWVIGDLRELLTPEKWFPFLDDIDVVVNCSGALQDGPDDDLEAIHHHAIAALGGACASTGAQLVQISAVGASPSAPTEFLASKGRGDAAIRSSGAKFQILRPGLVLAAGSYGGTTMLRMLAAVPLVQPIAVPDAKIQTVSLDDVAAYVSAAVSGHFPNGFTGDLVEPETHTLRELVAAIRHWLGFPAARRDIIIGRRLTAATGAVADGLAWLGWRSPLRTTAMTVLADGVTGDKTDLTQFGLPPVTGLSQTLMNMPTRAEDRLFARMALLTPFIIASLVVFWGLSGLIGFLRVNEAATVLTAVGWSKALAVLSVLFWAVVDIGIAVAFAYRPLAKLACILAVFVSLFYLAASTMFVPQLWLDPLGPLVKVIPGIVLALVARIALETR